MENAPSDVEMAPDDVAEDLASAESASEEGSSSPPPSSSPAHHSPIPIDDVDTPLPVNLLVPADTVDDAPSSNEAPVAEEGAKGKKSKPSSNVAAAGPSAKPKSSKSAAPRASSPSPPPPPARRPLETIRLDIQLGGPEDYEVNVSELAKATGQRQATPVPELKIPGDSSDESDGEDEPGGDDKPKLGDKDKLGDKVKLGDKAKLDDKETLTAKKRKVRRP